MENSAPKLLDAGSLDEIKLKGRAVVSSGPVPIVVFYSEGDLHAVDNRCPHMGFPLHRGTIEDGVLTCHWHHARFDLKSGCTFDLFADDATVYPVEVKDGRVYIDVSATPRDPVERGLRRLEEGMDQNIRLVVAKAVVALIRAAANPNDIVRVSGLYGVRRRRSGWSNGMTILSAMANVSDHLEDDERIAPLYQGVLHVASNTSGQPPRIPLRPLESKAIPHTALRRWFRYLIEVRNADGAERTLLAAIERPSSQADLAEMMVTAATDHFYLDGGHVIDFINKAFELLDRIGWEHAADVLPSLIRQLSGALRSEEQNSWRSPVDLVTLLSETFDSLNQLLEEGRGREWKRDSGFAEELLQDDPHAIVAALNEALRQGARPVQLAEAVALAAALRIVRFHVRNEFSDWISVLHTFSYANALHQMLKRAESAEMLRGVYHGAMRVYLDRFLNVPAARLPNPSAAEADDGKALEEYLQLLNQQQQVDEAGRLVNSFLASGGEPGPLFRTLAESLVREDAEFHSFQMLEAAIRQYGERTDGGEQRILMVAAARFLAAKAPTQRELLQTLQIAQRLHRGEAVYEED